MVRYRYFETARPILRAELSVTSWPCERWITVNSKDDDSELTAYSGWPTDSEGTRVVAGYVRLCRCPYDSGESGPGVRDECWTEKNYDEKGRSEKSGISTGYFLSH